MSSSNIPKIKTAIYDVETDGLLPDLTKIHVLCIYDYERREGHTFRKNDTEDTINDGLDLLEDAELVVGLNNIHFDMKAIEKVYGPLNWSGKHRDCMVLARMIFSNQKEKDFRLWEAGKLPGKLIGSHTLKGWGYRLNQHKGDYAEVKELEAEKLGIVDEQEKLNYIWGSWNQEMETYCQGDIMVTVLLWHKILQARYSEKAITLEHQIHDLMGRQEENGIHFNLEEANILLEDLYAQSDKLEDKAKQFYGTWYAPEKKKIVGPLWINEEVKQKNIKYPERTEWEQDESRAIWAEVTYPKRKIKYKDVMRADLDPEAPFCKIKLQEFNPNSRTQIIDRFSLLHNWHPVDFTEKGNPEVNDDVLRKLAESFEKTDAKDMALTLAELFYYKKRSSQLATGANALIKKTEQDGKIHGYVNVGGTVSGRASHVSPNLAQVPRVSFTPLLDSEGNIIKNDKGKTQMTLAKGRLGNHGWDFRNLFYVPEPWGMIGIDLEGIELRCFAEKLAKYDGGEYMKLVLSGDPHTYNQNLAGLRTRDDAKTFIYACVTMDTLALTREGWKDYDAVQVGDLVMTYNATKKIKEWKPVLEKVKYENAEVIELKHGHTFSIKCTPNHRWFTWRRQRVNGYRKPSVYEVVTTENLNTEHNIIVNAPMEDNIVGATITDPHIIPKWATDWDHKVLNMTKEQRDAWLSGFLVADGYWIKNKGEGGRWTWNQNNNSIASAAVIASYLSWNGRVILNSRTDSKNPMTIGRQNNRDYLTCQCMKKIKHPNQPVWCIRTENESWVVRQGNTITITGNTLYGAGDAKLGSIVNPLTSIERQILIGKALRLKFMTGLPAYAALITDIRKSVNSNGYILGLDGRRLHVRSPHSALNTWLQSDAALIAKKWVCLTEQHLIEDEGMYHSWEGDFAHLLWIHDEEQLAYRTKEIGEKVEYWAVKSAREAGEYFEYSCPVDAAPKHGKTWAETH